MFCVYSNIFVRGDGDEARRTEMDDFVFLKGPLVYSTIKISGINLSELDVGQFKKLVESHSNISPHEFG